MNYIKRYKNYFALSVFATFLPLFLLLFAGIADFIYDRGALLGLVVRYLPIHVLLIVLIYWTLRTGQNEDFELAESPQQDSRKWLLVSFVVLLTIVALMFWPLTNWSSDLYGGNGDGYNWRWIIWRMSQEFRSGNLLPTRFNDVIAPYGVDLRLTDGYLSMYIGGLWNLVTGPTLAYNLTLATSVVMNFFAARRLSLTISSSQMTGILAGIIMATAPSITLRHMGHLNLCFTFVMCLAAIEGLKLLEGKKVRIWQPVLVLALAFFSSFYFFVLSGIFYAACVLIRIARDFSIDRDSVKSVTARLASVVAITGILISPFILTRLQHDSAERAAGAPAASARTDEYMFYSADPRTFFLPPSDALVQLPKSSELRRNTSPNTVENTPFPGYVTLFAVGLMLMLVRRWRWFVASLWSIFTVLALGPTLIWGADSRFSYFFPHALVESASSQPVTWLPYGDLTAIPGLSALRTPNRFAMILPVLGVTALAVLAKEFLKCKQQKRIRLLALTTIVLLMLPNFRSSNYWYNTSFSDPVLQALHTIQEDPSDERVLVAGQNCVQTIFMANLQIEHGHPIVGCQTFSAAVPWYSSLEEYRNSSALAAVQCDPATFGLAPMNPGNSQIDKVDVLRELKNSLRVGYVIFPKNFSCTDQARTQAILEVLRTSSKIFVDSEDFLIVQA